MDEKKSPQASDRLLRRATTRMDAFSDGVMAIAITILVLEIALPAGSEDDLLQGIIDQWPSYLAYLVSFATIGAVWMKHTMVTDLMDYADRTFRQMNLVFLMLVSFVPFPTKVLAEHLNTDTSTERVAVMFYGIVLLASSAMIGLMWRYAKRAGLVDPDVSADDIHVATRLLNPSLAFYLVAIVVSIFVPSLGIFILFTAAALFLVPTTFVGRKYRR